MPETIVWPADLRPSSLVHYLEPHIGGAESPLTRSRKVYGLSRPRWKLKMGFRASWNGGPGSLARGGRLDALIAELEGGLRNASLFDFRRPYPQALFAHYGQGWHTPSPTQPGNLAALAGATQITFTGLNPNKLAFRAGDLFGGDGRIHMFSADGVTNGSGQVVMTFRPPLQTALGANAAVTFQPRGLYQLQNEDAGAAEARGRDPQAGYTLDFVEYTP